jgi:hypothetical protein
MKYRYKQTGTIVESGIALDSAIFTPVTDEDGKEKTEPAKEPAVKKTTRKTTAKK